MIFLLIIGMLFLIPGSISECLQHSCRDSSDCSSCQSESNFTHRVYSIFSFICDDGECVIDPFFYNTPEYKKARISCQIGKGFHCCNPQIRDSESRLKHCEIKACHKATYCTNGGNCMYDKEAEGHTENCCDFDEDCPPFSEPAFWNESAATLSQRVCQVGKCDSYSRTCFYENYKDCCVPETSDCDAFNEDINTRKCVQPFCIEEPRVLSNNKNVNPFVGVTTLHSRREITELFKQSALSNAYVDSNRCERRTMANCKCEYDEDCQSSFCTTSSCSTDGVCVVEPLLHERDLCCRGKKSFEKECVNKNTHPCLVPIACDSEPIISMNQTTILPTFQCRYIRKAGTASCCVTNNDCMLMANSNECVLRSCTTKKQCALKKTGYGPENLPCCFSNADCYVNVNDNIRHENGSCMYFKCTGDSLDVPINMRHKCVRHFTETCPIISNLVGNPNFASVQVEYNGCEISTIIHIKLKSDVFFSSQNDGIPLHTYPTHAVLYLSDYYVNVLAITLMDDKTITMFDVSSWDSKNQSIHFSIDGSDDWKKQQSLKGVHFHFQLLFDPKTFNQINSSHEKVSVKLTWTDHSESIFYVHAFGDLPGCE